AGSTATPTPTTSSIEVSVRRDLRIGETTNVPWLLELPDPITKLTWENAALLSPTTAAAAGVVDGDVVVVGDVRAPAIVQRGVADGVVVVHAGWGRELGPSSMHSELGFSAWKIAGTHTTLTKAQMPRQLLARTQL